MRIPGYTWKPVVGLERDPVIVPRLGILHIDGMGADSLFNWFNGPSKGIESHGFIPRSDEHEREQFRDTLREADANYRANSWVSGGVRFGALSWETQGKNNGTVWTPYQLAEIKRLMLICREEHDIPLKVAGSFHGRGWGYHVMFPQWSNVPGKVCPGVKRIAQFHEVLVPWMAGQRRTFYVVKPGDTVTKVAAKTGTTPAGLWRLNRPHLKPGEKLRIR